MKHGHLRAVQAYAVVRNTTDMQSSNELLLRASSVSVKHGHLRAVQAYTVVHNATDMQSSNELLLRASSVSE